MNKLIKIISAILILGNSPICHSGAARDSVGGAEYVEYATDTGINNFITSGGTFSTWIYIDLYPATKGIIYAKECTAAASCTGDFNSLSIRQSAVFTFEIKYIRSYTFGSSYSRTWNNVIDKDEWHHICMVKEGAGNASMNLYIDGQLKSPATSGTSVGTPVSDAARDMTLFGWNDGSSSSFDGSMAYASFYKKIFTNDECIEMMHKPLLYIQDSILAVPLWDGGSTEKDISSYQRTSNGLGGLTSISDGPPVQIGDPGQ